MIAKKGIVGFAPEARGSDACCLVGRKQQGEIGLPQASHLQMGRLWNIYGISMEYLSILLNYRVVMQISILMFFLQMSFAKDPRN